MTWVLAALGAVIVWATGFIAGARKASRRAAKRLQARELVEDLNGQTYTRYVSDSGFVWYEVKP